MSATVLEAVRRGDLDHGVKDRGGENQPEKRRNIIIAVALNSPQQCTVRGCARGDLELATICHHHQFVHFLESAHRRWHEAGHDLSFCSDTEVPLMWGSGASPRRRDPRVRLRRMGSCHTFS